MSVSSVTGVGASPVHPAVVPSGAAGPPPPGAPPVQGPRDAAAVRAERAALLQRVQLARAEASEPPEQPERAANDGTPGYVYAVAATLGMPVEELVAALAQGTTLAELIPERVEPAEEGLILDVEV